MDRLKPVLSEVPVVAQNPPGQGRPPAPKPPAQKPLSSSLVRGAPRFKAKSDLQL